MNDRKHYLNDFDFKNYINTICENVKQSNLKYSRVIGIASGGLPISVPIAEKLNLKHSQIKISFYGDSKVPKEVPDVNFFEESFNPDELVLVVDDLTDSGSTFKYFKEKIHQNAHFACIFHKKDNFHQVDVEYYGAEKPDAWIVFPYESE